MSFGFIVIALLKPFLLFKLLTSFISDDIVKNKNTLDLTSLLVFPTSLFSAFFPSVFLLAERSHIWFQTITERL